MVLEVVEVVLGEEDAPRATPDAVVLGHVEAVHGSAGSHLAPQLLRALAVGLPVEAVRALLLHHGRGGLCNSVNAYRTSSIDE